MKGGRVYRKPANALQPSFKENCEDPPPAEEKSSRSVIAGMMSHVLDEVMPDRPLNRRLCLNILKYNFKYKTGRGPEHKKEAA